MVALKNYGVIGQPIGHSLSPTLHGLFAQQTGENMNYRAIEGKIDGFCQQVKTFFSQGGGGLNVTLPFKSQAADLADELLPPAQQSGAVNTLWIADNRLMGTNTDGIGLCRDLQRLQQGSLAGQRILLLGAGGAAQGVLPSLVAQQPCVIFLYNRTLSKAQQLAQHYPLVRVIGSEQLNQLGTMDTVINATSASLYGGGVDLPKTLIAHHTLAYDMVYGKETPFMIWAKQAGSAQVADGLGMLIEQGAESFRLWRGVLPDTTPIYPLMRSRVG